MKSVCLNQCHNITGDALAGIDREIGKRLQELELVECKQINNQSLTSTVQLCSYLVKLNLRGVSSICDHTIIALATSCPYLEYLDLSAQMISSSTSTNSHTPRVGPEGVKALGTHCHRLRVLRCNGCTRLDDDCIMTVSRGCIHLEELALKCCYRITDEAIKAIGENCPSIVCIILSSCKQISDIGIKCLTQGCQKLKVIELMGVTQITDDGAIYIALNCPNLRRINLRDCYRLSDKSLLGLAAFCSHLEDIDMFAVDDLSNNSIHNLHKYCPSLRALNVGGSEISDVNLQELALAFYFCRKKEGNLALEPLHKSQKIHQQHAKVRYLFI